MSTVIVQYNAGNTASVVRALERLGVAAEITDSRAKILAASRVVVPGVGHAAAAMASLREAGLDTTLREVKAPLLGICLGMQILFEGSEEGDTACLGIVPGRVDKFTVARKVPHIGWNNLLEPKGALFKGIPEGAFVYFVHSYKAPVVSQTTARTEYEEPFSAAVEYKNFFGAQFHPEKSGVVGEAILKNFLEIDS